MENFIFRYSNSPLCSAGMPLKPAGPDSSTAAGRVLAAGGGLNGQFAWQGLAAGMAKVQREDALLKSAEQAFVATLGFLAGARLYSMSHPRLYGKESARVWVLGTSWYQ
jgi:hypothetical protein